MRVKQVADPHHFHAVPDPAFPFNAYPDPAPHQDDANLRPLVYRHSRAPYWASTPPLWTSTALKLLKFYFNADPDLSFHPNADPDAASASKIMRIRIRNSVTCWRNVQQLPMHPIQALSLPRLFLGWVGTCKDLAQIHCLFKNGSPLSGVPYPPPTPPPSRHQYLLYLVHIFWDRVRQCSGSVTFKVFALITFYR